ncbi:MAG TPA: NADH:ubiquinone reductase (Na(+)-transporting) subunit B [Verrucomicrobia bacterium]|jgi:Na+-transporting NADH:ubiquinone oxidoreductase subunit B|nr:NADH:ubiquinone reductase (Na(+)-transporting) subunit B [Verrucomicrobiota bacterium]
MKSKENFLDRHRSKFEKGGKFEVWYPLFEAVDTFLYPPKATATGGCHVRDAMDYKRMMMTVVVALVPCVLMAMFNVGLQANTAMQQMGVEAVPGWRGLILGWIGGGYSPSNIWSNLVHGALYFLPVYIVTMAVGLFWEVLFAIVRKHEVNEGFFVTGLLFPLTLPPTIPLWQVAIGITFGVVIAKEVFGGTGMNFLNPALAARAFLFFAYPAQISGDAVWTAVDGFSGATALGIGALEGLEGITQQITWWQAFVGTIQGSMGETSTLAALLGAVLLIVTGIGSWRIMLSMVLGAVGFAALLFAMGSPTNPMFGVPPHWHLVLGGFAFGTIFMATDPVSASFTQRGQWVYGFLIGVLVIMVRVINPAYPEGTMLAILLGNAFAPLIDYYVVKGNIKRRALRHAA